MRVTIPAPPYVPFAEFRVPPLVFPAAVLVLAASLGLRDGPSRGRGRRASGVVAIAVAGAALYLLGRRLWSPRRPVRSADQPAPSRPDRHLDELLDEAVEETFPASDPIAVHIE
jgi:hypothetical protein